MPVATTSATAVPAATAVPMNTKSERSASGAPAGDRPPDFSTGALSPVSDASFVDSAKVSSRRASAGTRSPASRRITSPATIADAWAEAGMQPKPYAAGAWGRTTKAGIVPS